MIDRAFQRNMTDIGRSPFTDKIKQTYPLASFTMCHFTSYKRDEDLEMHFRHYRIMMIIYQSNDALMYKIFTTTLQGERKTGSTPCLCGQSVASTNFPSLSLRNIFFTAKSKSSSRELICNYVKRFWAEKGKIVGCNGDIATTMFKNRLPTEHRLFEELIMGEELPLAASYALAKKDAL